MSICGRPSEEGDGEERNLEGKTRLWGNERCEMRLKITMVVALVMMLMVGVTGVCYPHNWTLITTSSNTDFDRDTMGIAGVTGYANLDNVKIDRGKHTIQFWTKTVTIDNSYSVDLNLVDYMYLQRTILQSAVYNSNGKFIRFSKLTHDKSIIWPESFFDNILKPVMLKYGVLHLYGRMPWTP